MTDEYDQNSAVADEKENTLSVPQVEVDDYDESDEEAGWVIITLK